MSKMPDKVQIGMRSVEVTPMRHPNAENAHGLCYYDEELIQVDTTRQSHYQVEILLHEIIHKCIDVYTVNLSPEMDEKIASVLGMALTQTLRDNPDLLKYISKTLKEPTR